MEPNLFNQAFDESGTIVAHITKPLRITPITITNKYFEERNIKKLAQRFKTRIQIS